MARKELRTTEGKIEQMKNLSNGIKYAVLQELILLGLVAEKERVTTEAVKEVGRGRKKIVYEVTKEGKAVMYPQLAKSWNKKTAA